MENFKTFEVVAYSPTLNDTTGRLHMVRVGLQKSMPAAGGVRFMSHESALADIKDELISRQKKVLAELEQIKYNLDHFSSLHPVPRDLDKELDEGYPQFLEVLTKFRDTSIHDTRNNARIGCLSVAFLSNMAIFQTVQDGCLQPISAKMEVTICRAMAEAGFVLKKSNTKLGAKANAHITLTVYFEGPNPVYEF